MRTVQLVIPDFTRPTRGDVAPPRLPALEWLLARGRREALAPPGWRQALLESAGFQCDGPLPLAATVADRPGHWALATPVCLLAGLETVHLHPAGLLRLDADEQHALAGSFGQVFGADGYRLEFRGGQGLLELPRGIQVETHDPAEVLGREASALLPQGTDAAWLRRLLTEIQMWLHDHPVNQRRESRGAPPCNALWIWGAASGRLRPPPRASLPRLASDDVFLQAAWRFAGLAPQSLPAHYAAAQGPGVAAHIVSLRLDALDPEPARALLAAEENWFEPLRAVLGAGQLDVLRLVLGRETLTCRPIDRVRFWRASRPWHQALS